MDQATAVALARSRWKYAEQELANLEAAIREFQDRRPYDARREFVPERREHIWKFRIIEEPPVEISLRISTVVHHLRATLDNLVWGLAKAEGASSEALRDVVYPIAVSRHDYWRRDEVGELHRDAGAQRVAVLPQAVRAIVEATQPFEAQDPAVHPLRLLQQLSNRDKHRTVAIAAAAGVGAGVALATEDGWGTVTKRDAQGVPRSVASLTRGPLVDGAVAARLVIPEAMGLDVSVQVHLAFDHVFADGPLVGRYLFFDLVAMLAYIDDHVLAPFSALAEDVDSAR